ncbi:hypothetical protein LSAT2_025964, partial [Lamellibrachia satsuma]
MPAMAPDWPVERQLSFVKDQLGVVVSDLQNIMARLRSVVGNLKVLCWQIDVASKGSVRTVYRAHEPAKSGNVGRPKRMPGDASQDNALLCHKRNIVLSLGTTILGATRRDEEHPEKSDCSHQANDTRSVGNGSPENNGKQHQQQQQQQQQGAWSHAKASFLRKQAATLRRTFDRTCRRQRRRSS